MIWFTHFLLKYVNILVRNVDKSCFYCMMYLYRYVNIYVIAYDVDNIITWTYSQLEFGSILLTL